MGNCDICLPQRVMVVGSLTDEFVKQTAGMLGGGGIECVVCEDVYSAVGVLARAQDGDFLVVGRFEELSKERGRFFRIAGERGCRCCCVVDGELVRWRKELLAAVQAGAFVVEEPAQVQEVVSKLLVSDVNRRVGESGSLNFIKDEFIVTEDEVRALLDSSADE